MKNSDLCVVVGNSSYVAIYQVYLGHEIKKIFSQDFPGGREKGTDLNSDRPGRAFDSMGSGRHAYSEGIDVHTREQQIFASQIADILKHEHDSNTIERLVLIAPPEFLGELRLSLSDSLKKAIYKEFNKDFPAYLSDQERIDKFCKLLEIKAPVAPRIYK